MDWYSFWNDQEKIIPTDNLLAQVGKTIKGWPVADYHVDLITESILKALEIDIDDEVVDLCCGNGLLTKRIATRSRAITGVDYSNILIETALRYHAAKNIRYINGSILDLVPSDIGAETHKFYMYEALQHFRVCDLKSILMEIARLSGGRAHLLLGSVPDKARRFRFYNTLSRRLDFFRRSLMGKEAIGTWWEREKIAAICDSMDFGCRIFDQDPRLYTAHYRFNALINIGNV